MAQPEKIALITGASRGIGRAAAISLARQGVAVAVTARTMKEGEGQAVTPFKRDQRTVPVPGSVASTLAAVRECGAEGLGLRLDIMDRDSISAAVEEILAHFGRIDILVNNAIYQGPGLMYLLGDVTQEHLESSVTGNLFNQFYLTQKVLPGMLERGSGVIINMSSGSALMAPPAPADRGGWGFAYAAAKSGFHRLAECLHVEHRDDGILAFNVEPGFTITETTRAIFEDTSDLEKNMPNAKPETTGDVITWLAIRPEAERFAGKLISSPSFFEKQSISFP